MLSLIFTPRATAEIPVTVGPVRGVRIEGNTLRDADSGAVLAECDDQHWVFAGKAFYRADCAGPVSVHVEGCEATRKRFGPFQHFSLSDGTAYVDRAIFARLNASNDWYVERVNTECPGLLLLPSDSRNA
jgi:hypothetical protein